MIKPDGVKRGLVGEVLHRIERRGFKIEKLEMRMATPELLEKHYEDLVDRPFFPLIVDFMTSGPVIAGVMSGEEVISSWRTMMGATNPKEALPEQSAVTMHKHPQKEQQHLTSFTVQIHQNQLNVKLPFGLGNNLIV